MIPAEGDACPASHREPPAVPVQRWQLYIKPHHPHEFNSVTAFDHAFSQLVVEGHLPVLNVVLKVLIDCPAIHRLNDSRQREIMGGYETEGSMLHKRVNDCFGTTASIV